MLEGDNRNAHSLLVEVQNGAATLEVSFTVFYFYKIKSILTIGFRNHVLCYLHKAVESFFPPVEFHLSG